MKLIKRMSFLVLLAAMVVFTPLDSSAQVLNGNQLVQKMREYDKHETGDSNYDHFDVGIYMGYVGGIFDVTADLFLDPPKGITLRQILAIVGKYLKENPEKWNEPARVLIFDALTKSIPLKRSKK